MQDLFDTLKSELEGLGTNLWDSFLANTKDGYTSAEFGKASKIMSRNGKGFCLTGNQYLNKLADSFTHTTVIAPSGGGKSTVCIIPNLLRNFSASLLVIDLQGELYAKTAPYLKSKGVKVLNFDLSNLNFNTDTVFYNPLSRLSKDDGSGIAKLANMLVKQASDKKDYWSTEAEKVVNLVIKVVLEIEPPERQHLANVHHLLQKMASDEEAVGHLLIEHDISEKIWSIWEATISNADNPKASVFSSAISSLNWIANNPVLATVTSKDTINFEAFRKERHALFIRIPVADQDVYSPLVTLLFSQFFSWVLTQNIPTENDLPILGICDEFGSLAPISGFSNYMATLRKMKVGLFLVLQSEAQLEEKYGKATAQVILNNTSKIYFGGLHHEAEKLSRMLGQKAIKEGAKGQERERLIPLMTEQQVRQMNGQVIIVPNNGQAPILANTKPYYQQPSLVRKTQIIIKEEALPIPIDVSLNYLTLPKPHNETSEDGA